MNTLQKTLCVAVLGLLSLAIAPTAQAQTAVVNPTQPNWGPPTPLGVQYYYVPEIAGYYELATRQYIVQRNGQWIRTETLPGYDSANFHPVILDYNGTQPWVRYNEYSNKYPKKGHPHGMPPGQAKKMQDGGNGGYKRDEGDRDGGKYKNKGKNKDKN
ncbi:hypothetical protein GCM10022409_42950 [Hymenobacter glaciei]|uniref:Uncharacterized protein n=1 Tax=Hymenobacter glaciei TaxID=877209 RepID=A0ABP7USA6_9BACT